MEMLALMTILIGVIALLSALATRRPPTTVVVITDTTDPTNGCVSLILGVVIFVSLISVLTRVP